MGYTNKSQDDSGFGFILDKTHIINQVLSRKQLNILVLLDGYLINNRPSHITMYVCI